jgi:hypothetical protein
MNKRKIVTISELPERLRKLSIDDISSVYGGCATYHQHCNKNEDCCGFSDLDACCGSQTVWNINADNTITPEQKHWCIGLSSY